MYLSYVSTDLSRLVNLPHYLRVWHLKTTPWRITLGQSTPNSCIPFTAPLVNRFDFLHRFANSTTAPIEWCNTYIACLCLPLTICNVVGILIQFNKINSLEITKKYRKSWQRKIDQVPQLIYTIWTVHELPATTNCLWRTNFLAVAGNDVSFLLNWRKRKKKPCFRF